MSDDHNEMQSIKSSISTIEWHLRRLNHLLAMLVVHQLEPQDSLASTDTKAHDLLEDLLL